MSQMLITSNPPSDNAARPRLHGDCSARPRLKTLPHAAVSASSSNGKATKCGWRSLSNAEKNGNSLIPSGCRLGMIREAKNHHELFGGGQIPATTLALKLLIPNASPASSPISPRAASNWKNVERLPAKTTSSTATSAAAADHATCTVAAAARLYATPGCTPLNLPTQASTK